MTYSDDSTETTALLARVAAGSSSALDRLLRLHRDYLSRIVQMRMESALKVRVDASDVVQETQIVIAKRIDDFIKRRPTSFRIWIRRKALEQLIDQRRRHVGAQNRSVLREQNLSNVSSIAVARNLLANTPSAILYKIELQQQIRGLIDQLSDKHREVLSLRHAEGLSTAEVADLLEIDPSTVRKRHGSALRRLHELFQENNISLDGS